MKAIIVDDEQDGRDVLSLMLKQFCPQVDILALCKNGKEAIQAAQTLQPDLVFLDIDMPDMNGFDVLDALPDRPFRVIFVTAHNQFAIRAIKYSAVDYILKPVAGDELVSTIQRLQNEDTRLYAGQLSLLREYLNARHRTPEMVALPNSHGLDLVHVQDIMYCTADGNYTTVYQTGNKKTVVSRNLKEFERMLEGQDFFRIHNSSLINLRFISRYIRGDGGQVVMRDGTHLDVARQKKDLFLQALSRM